MSENDILNEEALVSTNDSQKQKQDRKKYIKTIIISTAVVLALAIIATIIVLVNANTASGETLDTPTEVTQETEEVTESTSAPEIDISTNSGDAETAETSKPTEPTVGETVASTKPSKPSMPESEETKPTESTNPTVSENTPSEAPAAPERGDYPIDPPTNDRERLACVIYQEVGGNAHCDECRKRVGDIVLNRVNDPRFPNTIEGVLLQSGQYGRFSWTGIVWQSRAHNAGEKAAVERAYHVADELLAGNHSELYGNGYVWQAGFVQGSGGFWCCGHFFGK